MSCRQEYLTKCEIEFEGCWRKAVSNGKAQPQSSYLNRIGLCGSHRRVTRTKERKRSERREGGGGGREHDFKIDRQGQRNYLVLQIVRVFCG